MNRRASLLIVLLVTACASQTPPAPAPAVPAGGDDASGRVPPSASSTPAGPPASGTPRSPLDARGTAPPLSGVAVPPGRLYVCVTESGGERRQVGIELEPRVQALCERHPEMGPCQYERTACRKAGGRVFDVAGREITLATEADYDRKVMRFRLRSN